MHGVHVAGVQLPAPRKLEPPKNPTKWGFLVAGEAISKIILALSQVGVRSS